MDCWDEMGSGGEESRVMVLYLSACEKYGSGRAVWTVSLYNF